MSHLAKKLMNIILLLSVLHLTTVEGMIVNSIFTSENENIILSNSLYNSAPQDLLEIENYIIKGDFLLINVTYGGGCIPHSFKLIGSNEFAESFPVQTYVLLSHDSYNDSCEALIKTALAFNLFPLAEKYMELYQTDSATLILHIIGNFESFSVNYLIEKHETESSSTVSTSDTYLTRATSIIYPFTVLFTFSAIRKKKKF